MIKIILTIALYLITLVSFSQNEEKMKTNTKQFDITVSVINVPNNKGKIFYGLHNKTTFLKKSLSELDSKIINGVSTVTFKDIPVGTYAIACYHDSNNNNKMDFESNGMPLEDYGATNNVMNFGPPQFKDSKFEVTDKDLTFEIKF
jgi:uncharacterized protein (DUF2141 family)